MTNKSYSLLTSRIATLIRARMNFILSSEVTQEIERLINMDDQYYEATMLVRLHTLRQHLLRMCERTITAQGNTDAETKSAMEAAENWVGAIGSVFDVKAMAGHAARLESARDYIRTSKDVLDADVASDIAQAAKFLRDMLAEHRPLKLADIEVPKHGDPLHKRLFTSLSQYEAGDSFLQGVERLLDEHKAIRHEAGELLAIIHRDGGQHTFGNGLLQSLIDAKGEVQKLRGEADTRWQPVGPDARRCKPCNAPRKGPRCWKCGADTFTPHPSWVEAELPDVRRIRELAKEVGYAIGEHGSRERDLDLIAVPWSNEAVGFDDLVAHICEGINAKEVGDREKKPHGRVGVNLQIDGYYKLIDLSVTPRTSPHPAQDRYEHFLSYSGLADDPMMRYAYFHGADADCEKPPRPKMWKIVALEPSSHQLHAAYDQHMMHLPYRQSTCHELAANIYRTMVIEAEDGALGEPCTNEVRELLTMAAQINPFGDVHNAAVRDRAKKLLKLEPQGEVCDNCGSPLPGGCYGRFASDGTACQRNVNKA